MEKTGKKTAPVGVSINRQQFTAPVAVLTNREQGIVKNKTLCLP
jgi:hypothetical protein